jgi:aspartate kinase
MVVYKFGGASVRDSDGIRNLYKIVSGVKDNLVVVVSAFGKTTNSLEAVLESWLGNDKNATVLLDKIFEYHMQIAGSLFKSSDPASDRIRNSFAGLREYLRVTKPGKYDFEYDQVVSMGEVWSTIIVEEFLKAEGLKSEWADIREYLKTDDRHRDANILWGESSANIKRKFDFASADLYVTQGFIGSTAAGNTTTLGREGSDYTAAIIGNILEADKVVFWKDVPGILNADPRWMDGTVKLGEISYKEAVEMTFSGAKVIHPKTIKPLHNKNIPLIVKSFVSPSEEGTVIRSDAGPLEHIPVFMKKEEQILISILPRDFSFVMGDNLARIFHTFMLNGIKVNMVQASAVSIDVCVDNEKDKIDHLMDELKDEFKAIYNDDAELITIRHFTPGAIEKTTFGREILLEQKTRRIARFVMKRLR